MAQSMGIPLIGIKRDIGGYDFRELERIFKTENIHAFYLIPRFQNPTGYSLAEKEKRKIAELCAQYGILILEDDFLADLGTGSGELPIHYYDTDDRTFYIRSFSKTFMPGIRLGTLVLPKQFAEQAIRCKRLDDLNTSSLPQAALELFIQTGMYEKHIRKVKEVYRDRLEKARNIFASLCTDGISWYVPKNGFFISMKIPRPIDLAGLKAELEQQGILIRTGEENFLSTADRSGDRFLSLCIANVPTEKMDALVAIISTVKNYL
jgi:DNA-binding transcriptional MocR family regulator